MFSLESLRGAPIVVDRARPISGPRLRRSVSSATSQQVHWAKTTIGTARRSSPAAFGSSTLQLQQVLKAQVLHKAQLVREIKTEQQTKMLQEQMVTKLKTELLEQLNQLEKPQLFQAQLKNL